YFSNGIHDFEQASLTLLDYSVLLVPPYKGLERFVFDLQRAEGINVKMIGQAFDKDEAGRYILKRGYQHRIGSVIYSEVMVALYSEYFSRRNFITHSDNTGGSEPRSISDRQEAKRIFDNLLNIVEYNAKKLKEIGFKMERDA
ncbi:MAG: type II toxin-antitoxin system RnlA family toxin, partial [Clostridiales bacterium]|nr:type II toxin-antitoxin system RnlA family toxin [Clostridiales bacterium]